MRQWSLWSSHLRDVKPYYAVKCNPEKQILQWLKTRGAGFDCASAREMFAVKDALGSGQNIIFANPCKTMNDMRVGSMLRVPWVVTDSVEELYKMDKEAYKPRVVLRLAVDDSASECPFSMKFGCLPEKAKEVASVAKLLQMPLQGLSFHVGSGSKSASAFGSAIHQAKEVWGALADSGVVERQPQMLDLGGGWSADEKLFTEQATSATKALGYLGEMKPSHIIAEPGRFFAKPTHDLYVQVIGKKPTVNGKGWRYTLDESIYGQFSCIPFDHATPSMARVCIEPNDSNPRNKTPAVFFGRTCDSLDWIGQSEETEELEVGDWLYVPNMGAYTTATSTEFNGFPKPSVLATEEEPEPTTLKWLTGMKYPLATMLTAQTEKLNPAST